MTRLAGACTIALPASVVWYGSALAGATATRYHRLCAALGIFLVTLIIAPQKALPTSDSANSGPVIPPQLEEELSQEVLDAPLEEQQRRTNEAVIVVPFANNKVGILVTFGDFMALTRPRGKNAASISVFKDRKLVQRIVTTLNFPYGTHGATGTLAAMTSIKDARTGDNLVSELTVALGPSQTDECSFVMNRTTTVLSDGMRGTVSSGESFIERAVFDDCREVIVEYDFASSIGNNDADELEEQFKLDVIRTLARILREEATVFGTVGLAFPERVLGIPTGFEEGFLGGRAITKRCFLICLSCFLSDIWDCPEWYRCAARLSH